MCWYVYIVKCRDDTLYTGITKNPVRRIFEHNTDDIRGSRYVRSKRPVKLIYSEKYTNRIDALKREYAIKNWKREYKLKLIERLQK